MCRIFRLHGLDEADRLDAKKKKEDDGWFTMGGSGGWIGILPSPENLYLNNTRTPIVYVLIFTPSPGGGQTIKKPPTDKELAEKRLTALMRAIACVQTILPLPYFEHHSQVFCLCANYIATSLL